jgi:FMN phosphatase YigB (HAD superfamily)
MENKTQQFLRVSNMTGVPLERMVFIGDSDAHYRSPAQLGIHFVENRYNAIRHDVGSLVKSLDPEGRPFLSARRATWPPLSRSWKDA